MERLDVQARLRLARAANRPGSRVPHTVVVLPSYSVDAALVAHYGQRIPALEHRQLLTLLMLARIPGAELIFVTTRRPAERVLDYYLSFVPASRRPGTRSRIRILEIPDPTPRSITAKLLDRPDLLERLRTMTRGRLAYIEPWNVTQLETEVAERLGLPLNGSPPRLWPLGFKSNGRRLMRSAEVPVPLGHEDVRDVPGVLGAVEAIRRRHAHAVGAVIKLDDSAAGEGNRVVRFDRSRAAGGLPGAVESLDPGYLASLAAGAVVEELVTGTETTSPSVQIDIAPGHRVQVVSTHEQILGGPNGQVYEGCRFPADPGYRNELTTYGEAVGHLLSEQGAMGRLCIDFVASRSPAGWQLHGLEINLRKSGTSHPLSLLHNLVPGSYDGPTGTWSTRDGSDRCYRSTDSLIDPDWRGRPADDVIAAIASTGLEFDPGRGVGVVLHMFVGLDLDGCLGLTAIGRSPDHADRLYAAAVGALGASATGG